MTQDWPWPDDRLERRSRIAHMYRDALTDEAPAAAADLDGLMRTFGQDWIVEALPTDPEALLSVAELAALADVPESTVRNWVARWPLARRGIADDGRALYRWGDVIDRQRLRKR